MQPYSLEFIFDRLQWKGYIGPQQIRIVRVFHILNPRTWALTIVHYINTGVVL